MEEEAAGRSDSERHPVAAGCRLDSVALIDAKELAMTVTPGEPGDGEVGTSSSPALPAAGRHAVRIAYLSALASLLTAAASLLAVLLR
jgi:hypothetical protein